MRVFADRRDAGRKVASRFDRYAADPDVVVLGLPRGGVPVAYEIARRIGAPLDVLVVRKLGVPGHEELAMGAIASGGIQVVDARIMNELGISRQQLEAVAARARVELERRERAFRDDRPPLDVAGKVVILVDDGLATGASMTAAIDALRTRGPARIIAAVPVAPPETCAAVGARADEMICLFTPEHMYAVGAWYEDFAQTSDDEVHDLLERAAQERPGGVARDRGAAAVPPDEVTMGPGEQRRAVPAAVNVTAGLVTLRGDLAVPPRATGIIVFAHGSGLSRTSPRNRAVAWSLVNDGFAALLFDLLTPEEETVDRVSRRLRFDIPLLADRLVGALAWVSRQRELASLPIGLFGASTGAAAALIAAATVREVGAVVSRGGRPDLAGATLARVRCPTLFIVGGADPEVIELNRRAMTQMRAPTSLHIVPDAGHLFEEPGALREVTEIASGWFVAHLAVARRPGPHAPQPHH